ncbi:hypothetical protein VIBNIAM115_1810014 [Vibrio nigripulchritudo AM115]|nr:hypothetical protein VIBNIAM115_1810014 [Vibrio nigripulchritudo AM115]
MLDERRDQQNMIDFRAKESRNHYIASDAMKMLHLHLLALN